MNERAKLVTFGVGNTDVSGQSLIPVFKLVSPDGTGGSRECIIFSKRLLKPPDSLALKAVASVHHIYQRATSDWLNLRESVLGGVNVYVGVGDRLETDPVLQGRTTIPKPTTAGRTHTRCVTSSLTPMRRGFM